MFPNYEGVAVLLTVSSSELRLETFILSVLNLTWLFALIYCIFIFCLISVDPQVRIGFHKEEKKIDFNEEEGIVGKGRREISA